MKKSFFNQSFNKGKLKTLLIWCIINFGQNKMIHLAEDLKNLGFTYATNAGISLGIDDLQTISTKYKLIKQTNQEIQNIKKQFELGKISEVDESQNLIDNWQKISEILKKDINGKFKTINKLNPIYMMAFSGARGNISQVRQLIGMRGLMADPNGQIIHLPIKSNFREGLSVTEYLISCYGARKGVVDTALRTATAGYLTRRLVDTTQHVIISELDCGTKQGIFLSNLYQNKEIILSLKDQLYGRTLGEDMMTNPKAIRNQQIDEKIALLLSKRYERVFVRSCLSCQSSNLTICQLCYGWNLAHSKLTSLGEVVGVIAAQSIGEPGTQLTMRTFHTGGVFSGGVTEQMYAPFDGIILYSTSLQGNTVVTQQNQQAFFVKKGGWITILPLLTKKNQSINRISLPKKFKVHSQTLIFKKNQQKVKFNELIAQLSNNVSNDQQIEAKYMVNSKVEGEVYFDNFNLSRYSLNKLQRKSRIWVLYGKVYRPLFPFKVFPQIGDFVSYKFPLGQIDLLNPTSSFMRSLLIRKNKKNLSNDFSKKDQFFLFMDYPLYEISLDNIKILENNSFLSSSTNKNYEIRRIKRITKTHLVTSKFIIPSNKLCKIKVNKNISMAQQNVFVKQLTKNTNLKYDEMSLQKNNCDSLTWFIPYFYVNDSAILQYESSVKLNQKTKLANPIPFLQKEKNLFFHQKSFLKDNVLFINNKIFHISAISLDHQSKIFYKKIEIKKEKNYIKNLFLNPYSSIKYFTNDYIIQSLNYKSKPFEIKPNNIAKIQLQFDSLLYKKQLKVKINPQTKFIRKNYLIFTLLNFYVLPNLIKDKKLSKIVNIFKQFYIKLTSFQNQDLLMTLISIIQSVIEDYFEFNCNFKIFVKDKLVSKIIPNFSSQTIVPVKINKQNFLLIYKKDLILNSHFINITPSNTTLLNIYPFNKYINDKNGLQTLKLQYTQFILPNNSKNFIQTNLNNIGIYTFRQSLKIKIYDGNLYLSNLNDENKNKFLKTKNLKDVTFFSNSYFYLEEIQMSRLFKEYKTVLSKLPFWKLKQKIFFRTFFHIKSKSNFLPSYNLKTKMTNNIFDSSKPKIFSVKNFNIDNHLSISLISDLDLKIPYVLYNSLKKVNQFPILKNINYNQLLFSKSKTIFSSLSQNRSKNIFFENKYLSYSEKLFSFKSLNFNKRNSTQFNFLSAYKQTTINFYFKLPPLLSSYFKPNTHSLIIRVKNKGVKFSANKILNRLKVHTNAIFEKSKLYKNMLVKPKNSLNFVFQSSLINQIFKRALQNKNLFNKRTNNFQFSKNHLDWIPKYSTVLTISFLSPYEGEVISQNLIKFTNRKTLYNEILILTKKDKCNLSWLSKQNQQSLIISSNYFISKSKLVKIKFQQNFLIDSNSKIAPGKFLKNSGKILLIKQDNFILRKGFPILSSNTGIFHVWNGDFIKMGSPIMTLLYRKMRTGDIVQGIPKIEHFFEARKGMKGIGNSIQNNLYLKLLAFFLHFNKKLSLCRAIKRSYAKIQKIIIDGICRVYCSQGILISRKHFEIVVKQMTSKVKIVDGGETGLLEGELVNFSRIERINQSIHYRRITYEPIVLGITKVSLRTDSFISSASFQETTKVLSQSSLEGKLDFLGGLKENVILGKLIPGGTGAIINIISDRE